MASKFCKVIFNTRFYRFAHCVELDIQNGDLQNGVSEKEFFSVLFCFLFFFICPFILSFVCPSGFCSDDFFQLDHYFFEKKWNGVRNSHDVLFQRPKFLLFYPQNGAKWAENRFLEVTEKIHINFFSEFGP